MSDLIWQRPDDTGVGDQNPSKRKRAEALFDTAAAERDEVQSMIETLVSKARTLEGHIGHRTNTKKEIKETGEQILRISLKLERLYKDRPKTDKQKCQHADHK
nr:unnamed protein product [Callosobruchus analis]